MIQTQARKEAINRYTLATIVVGIAIAYASLSANCATGGSCEFANGDLANWLFLKVKVLESVFWKIVSS